MSVFKLASVITAHAWSPDGNSIAVCKNEPDVTIYTNCKGNDVSKWKESAILRMHTMVVTGIDWSPANGKIVTCSHDVTAFVWSYDRSQDQWIAKVSVLKIERAAIRVKWSPDGQKFAVASGSKVASICFFQPEQDWWVSQLTKRGAHKSTVLDVAWHPSSQLFATACCDFKCRIFSAFIEKVDSTAANTVLGSMHNKGFGQLMIEFEATGAWIEAVAWSPSGNGLAFIGHDATISFVDLANDSSCTMIKTRSLPYTRLLFLEENVVVAAGYDFVPEVFQGQGGSWKSLGSIDKGEKKVAKKGGGGFMKSMNKFKQQVNTGQVGGSGASSIKSLHWNVITDISNFNGGFSTAAQDGRIIVWDKAHITSNAPGVKI